MDQPRVAQKQPAVLELEPGTYYWCACGRSQKQPFCDGSHKGTAFTPVRLELTAKQKVALCQCKQTKNAPMCDGSHKQLVEG